VDNERLRLRGTRRRRLRTLERDERELEEEPELDLDVESEPDSESEPEAESEEKPEECETLEREDVDASEDRLARFRGRFFSFPFLLPSSATLAWTCCLSFSLDSRILLATPLLFLNSSGTSTEGFPSALSFASSLGFSSCCVRDGRETYGRVDLHS